MKLYIRAYWFDDNNESIDDFIYGRTPSSNSENFYDEDNAEFVSENSFEDDLGYSDFDDYVQSGIKYNNKIPKMKNTFFIYIYL